MDTNTTTIHDLLAEHHVTEAHHGKRWAWSEAAAFLDAAYGALGASNPADGADWHAGNHSIQQSRFHPLAGLAGEESA